MDGGLKSKGVYFVDLSNLSATDVFEAADSLKHGLIDVDIEFHRQRLIDLVLALGITLGGEEEEEGIIPIEVMRLIDLISGEIAEACGKTGETEHHELAIRTGIEMLKSYVDQYEEANGVKADEAEIQKKKPGVD